MRAEQNVSTATTYYLLVYLPVASIPDMTGMDWNARSQHASGEKNQATNHIHQNHIIGLCFVGFNG